MPRKPRNFKGECVYHVMNRAAAGVRLFHKDGDYAAFERVLEEACGRVPMRVLSYVVMPNHFHLVLWPTRETAGQVSDFMRWLQVTHAQRYRAHYASSGAGHLYQGRFKAFPVQASGTHFQYLLKTCRYVERNPLRAGLVVQAEAWRWGSLWRRVWGTAEEKRILAEWPTGAYPGDGAWLKRVNTAQRGTEEEALRLSIRRGRPFGDAEWTGAAARAMDLGHTLRPRGRPRKGAKNDS